MRRSLVVLVCTVGVALAHRLAAADEPGGLTCAVVGIDRIGAGPLERLQRLGPVAWWIEADGKLLVCGDDVLSAVAAAGATVLGVRTDVREDRLVRLRGIHGDDLGPAVSRTLIQDGPDAVVELREGADPDGLAHAPHPPSPSGVTAGPTCMGAAIEPFERNVVLSRQAANLPPVPTRATDPAIQGLLDEIDPDRWRSLVFDLSAFHRHTLAPELDDARDWIAAQLGALPDVVVTTPSFDLDGTILENVVATLPGTSRPDEWWIVGAHYDARTADAYDAVTFAPGAEDNAGGCSGVLELARIFTTHRPAETVIFACYAGEELGMRGSRAHAEALVQNGDGPKLQGMLNLDGISYTSDDDYDVRLGWRTPAETLAADFTAAAATYTDLRVVTGPFTCCTDHIAYLERGLPAISITTADLLEYPHYHATTDAPVHTNGAQAGEVLRAFAALLAERAGAGRPPFFRDGFESGDPGAWASPAAIEKRAGASTM